MKLAILSAMALLPGVCLHAVTWDNTQQRTFTVGNSLERRLVLENINGNIRVTGDGGNTIRLTVREHFSAESDAALARARQDIQVEMVQEGDLVRVSVEGPSRGNNRNRDRDWWRDEGKRDESRERYEFRHDYDVLVPRDLNLALRTVNGSELMVAGVSGEWNLQNVNGAVTLRDTAGWGRIKTVNGQVKVTFTSNPQKPSSFETLNGSLDVTFQPGLSADLKLSTFNGEAYTDFDVTPRPLPVVTETSKGGHRFRLDRNRGVRIGNGGIEHSFKTFNGSIRIRKSGTN